MQTQCQDWLEQSRADELADDIYTRQRKADAMSENISFVEQVKADIDCYTSAPMLANHPKFVY